MDKYTSFASQYGEHSITTDDPSSAIEVLELGKYRIWGYHGREDDPEYELQILKEGPELPGSLEEELSIDIAKALLEGTCGVYDDKPC